MRRGSFEISTRFARRPYNALRAMTYRALLGLAMIGAIVAIVMIGRDGYVDEVGGPITFVDAIYYATVSITTTGYGDITPVSSGARLVTTILVTPLRIGFLVLLLGTTVEVLATDLGVQLKREIWRRRVRDHYVICGWGVKGRSAADALISAGISRSKIVVIERERALVNEANEAGFTAIQGNSTRGKTLEEAMIAKAKCIIVAVDTDEVAVLTTLTARDLNADAKIVAAVRESENAQLLTQSGATTTIVSDEESGRLLGIASDRPALASILHDLLHADSGLYLDEIEISDRAELDEIDGSAIAIVRNGKAERLKNVSEAARLLEPGDRVIVLRQRA